jgi:glycosyltransferase involved in cell wall biosynthesis
MTSTSFPSDSSDWRGTFIRQMVFSIAERREIELSFWGPPGELPPSVQYQCSASDESWLADLANRGGIAHLMRTRSLSAMTTPLQLMWRLRGAYRRAKKSDIFHANWLQLAMPMPSNGKPILVTVLGTDYALLKLPLVAKRLRSVFSRHKTIIAPNADWMVSGLKEKFGDIAIVRCIPFGIDPGYFDIRRSPTINGTRRWLLVSRLTKSKIGPLFEWGQSIFSGATELHVLGPMQEQISIPSWVHYHGPTNPEVLKTTWFPQATGLISLSEHDEGRPQVILEAMAAGLPVVASPLRAHTGVITHKDTGWIAATCEEAMAGIEWVGVCANNVAIGQRARQHMKNEVGTWTDCAGRYAAAYKSLLDTTNG